MSRRKDTRDEKTALRFVRFHCPLELPDVGRLPLISSFALINDRATRFTVFNDYVNNITAAPFSLNIIHWKLAAQKFLKLFFAFGSEMYAVVGLRTSLKFLNLALPYLSVTIPPLFNILPNGRPVGLKRAAFSTIE